MHVEVRDLGDADLRAVAVDAEPALARLPHVRWARLNPVLGRVVVDAERGVAVEDLVDCLDEIERRHGVGEAPFPARHPERYPGDREPIARTLVEIGAELASLGGGAVLRRLGVKPLAFELDLAVVLAMAENVPRLRRAIDRALSIAFAEVTLEVARAGVQALLHGSLGPAAGIVGRGLRLRELAARRGLWRELESELCGTAEAHDMPAAADGVRPEPLPDGPIESYSDKAVLASLGAFATTLASTHRVSDAAASIFGGLPKPARLGREAFAAHLGARLAARGVLVLEPQQLRHLDRLDTVVVVDRVVAAHRDGDRVLAGFGDLGLRVVVAGEDELVTSIRRLQRDGRGVCLVAAGPSSGFGAADVGVGLCEPHAPPPWRADILCRHGLADASMIVEAIVAARVTSKHGVALSAAEAAVGLGLALAGLRPETSRRIMALANATSLLAIANGMRLAHRIDRRIAPEAPDAPPWHRMTVDEVFRDLDSRPEGLAEPKAAARRRPVSARRPVWELTRLIAEEVANPMTVVLAVGAGLSAVVGSPVDAALIASVMLANGAVGGVQRFRIERIIRRLDDGERRAIKVRRGGRAVRTDPALLVPGDVIEIEAGEVVPADCRIVDARALEVDESSLTGESLPVAKQAEPVVAGAVADRASMLYQQTSVSAGAAVGVVVAVGEDTEARRALAAAGTPPPGGVEVRLETLTRLTLPVATVGGLAAGAMSVLRGQSARDALSTAVSLSAAAVPEGLPMLATLAQLAAADRLSSRGALVHNPRAIESLGRVDVLCADKTGTLTEGRIELTVVSDGRATRSIDDLDDPFRSILSVALRASPSSDDGRARLPHLTDQALVAGARRAGARSHDGLDGWQRLHELPFEPSRSYHAGLARYNGDSLLLSVKGAPEVVVPRCDRWRRDGAVVDLTPAARAEILATSETLAGRGLRVLAIAERTADRAVDVDAARVDRLVFCGFVGLADPVRATAPAAVAELARAGVDVVMLTGDHPHTAERIAAELGILDGRRVVSGAELEELDDAGLDAIVSRVAVFSRVSPLQKLRIVQSLQRVGRVVAMTGDGANDAPAIRLADCGIALGGDATAAARHAADIVVTDERIETLVYAVLEGRGLWVSVRDAVSLLVGGNLGEIAFTALAAILSGEAALNARQLLLVNLITDSLPALALAVRPPAHTSADELLREGPDRSLGSALTRDVVFRAGLTAGAAGLAYGMARVVGTRARASTVGLVALSASQLGQTMVVGGTSRPALVASVGSLAILLGFVQTPGLSHFFGCRPLGPLGLAQAGLASSLATGAAWLVPRLIGEAADQPDGGVPVQHRAANESPVA